MLENSLQMYISKWRKLLELEYIFFLAIADGYEALYDTSNLIRLQNARNAKNVSTKSSKYFSRQWSCKEGKKVGTVLSKSEYLSKTS